MLSYSEKDAQMCIYHISWQSNYGFCCELDEESAQELAGLYSALLHPYSCCVASMSIMSSFVGVPGVLSIQPDENFGSDIKNYGGLSSSSLIFMKVFRIFCTQLWCHISSC